MFASLAYANLEEIPNYNIPLSTDINNLTFSSIDIPTDSQLEEITTNAVLFQENTYDYLFYGLASTTEVSEKNWKIVNYSKITTTFLNSSALFTAMTFQRGNDIVIAYRGTDFDDLAEWGQDIAYGLLGATFQEDATTQYALNVAKNFPNHNIYVTGHSLGGYLAQIGGAALINNGYGSNIKEIGYFNGMGLFFFSNIENKIIKACGTRSELQDLSKLVNPNSTFYKSQITAKQVLKNWYNNGGKLVSYQINGDLVSSLGQHCGDIQGFNAHPNCIQHYGGYSSTIYSKLVKNTLKFIDFALNNEIYKYVDIYKPRSFLGYLFMTHETDSFFGVEDVNYSIDVSIGNIQTIKRRGTQTAKLTITTKNSKLADPILTKNDFVRKNLRISIDNVSYLGCVDNEDNTYTYTYNIKIKGLLIGSSSFSLKANSCSLAKDTTFANILTSSKTFKVSF